MASLKSCHIIYAVLYDVQRVIRNNTVRTMLCNKKCFFSMADAKKHTHLKNDYNLCVYIKLMTKLNKIK